MSVGVFEWARSVVAIAKEGEAAGIPTIEESDLSELAAAKWILAQAEADRWIPVGERLPPDGDRCWCANVKSGGTFAAGRLGGVWYFTGDGCVAEVTHWRPLPGAPE